MKDQIWYLPQKILEIMLNPSISVPYHLVLVKIGSKVRKISYSIKLLFWKMIISNSFQVFKDSSPILYSWGKSIKSFKSPFIMEFNKNKYSYNSSIILIPISHNNIQITKAVPRIYSWLYSKINWIFNNKAAANSSNWACKNHPKRTRKINPSFLSRKCLKYPFIKN